jgi:2-dehydropantoate 2-reductase
VKICIFGAGAVGGMIGGELARAGNEVTLIARGAHLAAMRANGLTVIFNGERRHTAPSCTDDPAEAGKQEAVIFVVKAHQLAAAAAQAAPLLGPDTIVVAAQNGIPWWYCHGLDGRLRDATLTAVDPGGRIRTALGAERVVGAVINGSCALLEPGVIDHHQPDRSLTIGEPACAAGAAEPVLGPRSARAPGARRRPACAAGAAPARRRPAGPPWDRCRRLAEAFAGTDIEVPVVENIRDALWSKLLSNIGISMICVLTRSPLGPVNGDPRCFALARAIMRETGAVAAAAGVDLAAAVEARIAGGPVSLVHKPSTLQDFEAGRPMEIDAICGAVLEIARLVGQPTPVIDHLYALLRRLAEQTGTYPANPEFALEFGDP